MSTTEFEKVAERARSLSDAQLTASLVKYQAGVIAGAIRLELARRRVEEQKNEARLSLFR